jgi:hypothetical protein
MEMPIGLKAKGNDHFLRKQFMGSSRTQENLIENLFRL